MRKVTYFIFFLLLCPSMYPQKNELGLNLRYGFTNYSEFWYGVGLNYSHYIYDSGSIKLSIIGEQYNIDSNTGPFELAHSMSQSEIRIHYFYHIPENIFYFGLGSLYSWNTLTTSHQKDLVFREVISDSWGIDLAAGINVGKFFNIETSYTFKYPDLNKWYYFPTPSSESGFEVRERQTRISLNAFHINLLLFFSF